jgi:RNA polymerase sigma-70 factor (ECF subfamily)
MTAAETALADAHRREWATVLAATVRVARDLDLAEECVQEAYASAMTAWKSSGVPDKAGRARGPGRSGGAEHARAQPGRS